MRTKLTFLLLVVCIIVNGQNPQVEKIGKLYMSGKLDQAIEEASKYLETDQNNIECKLILGRAFSDKGIYEKAIPNLKYTADNDINNSWKKAWALGYLGHCQFMIEEYDRSKKSLSECVNLNVTKNATRYAFGRKLLFGFDDFYNDWQTVESDNFRFHFQSMSKTEIEKYIQSHEIAFKNINAFFKSNLPKKIDFFVWTSREDAKKLMNAKLGFAKPSFCVVHSHYQQTKGHEMTHVIANYTSKISNKTRFINEGTAVCFDQTNRKYTDQIKKWFTENNRQLSIKEFWKNGDSYAEEILYPVSGMFVEDLIKKFGRDKFIKFFNDQTYENAKSVFGNDLDNLIAEFENKFNG